MKPLLLFITRFLFHFIPDTHGFGMKRVLLRLSGAKIGKNVRICSSVKIFGNCQLSINDNTWIGHDSMIVCSAPISIGKNVNIAPRCYIGTGTHEIDSLGNSVAGKGVSSSVTIADGSWICVGCIILPGVCIGTKSICASGAVVNRDVEDNELVGGVPIQHIKYLK